MGTQTRTDNLLYKILIPVFRFFMPGTCMQSSDMRKLCWLGKVILQNLGYIGIHDVWENMPYIHLYSRVHAPFTRTKYYQGSGMGTRVSYLYEFTETVVGVMCWWVEYCTVLRHSALCRYPFLCASSGKVLKRKGTTEQLYVDCWMDCPLHGAGVTF